MANKSIIKALPKHPNKYDTEFFQIEIVGTYTRGQLQHEIEKLDNALHH